jgi:predicted phosphodiesterase
MSVPNEAGFGMAGKRLIRRAAQLLTVLLLLNLFQPSALAREPVTFAVVGDTGTGLAPAFEVARQMKIYRDKIRFDFVLMLGDNVYPDGNPSLLKRCFEEPYKDLLNDGVKFYAVLGNHDVRKGAKAQINYDKFNMRGRRYYSFKKGEGLIDRITGDAMVEFFALDSNAMSQEQLSWLEGALKSSKARWKVVFMHHSVYSSARKHGSNGSLRKMLEPLFIRYKVDVVLAGHEHVYERLKPQNGVRYFTQGASGQLRKGNINRKSATYEAGNDDINSFLVIQLDQSEMKFRAIAANGTILDEVAITKSR